MWTPCVVWLLFTACKRRNARWCSPFYNLTTFFKLKTINVYYLTNFLISAKLIGVKVVSQCDLNCISLYEWSWAYFYISKIHFYFFCEFSISVIFSFFPLCFGSFLYCFVDKLTLCSDRIFKYFILFHFGGFCQTEFYLLLW